MTDDDVQDDAVLPTTVLDPHDPRQAAEPEDPDAGQLAGEFLPGMGE